MNEIKCPNCKTVFQINEQDYDSIVKQIRDNEFEREIKTREKQFQDDKEKTLKIQEAELKNETAKEINKRVNYKQDILLEVNIANEESKYGFLPDTTLLKETLQEISKLNNINCIGLMCVAPNTTNPKENKKYFSKLKDLANSLNLKVLSMGMTNDYIYACECNSTYIRIGTGIFGERNYSK